MPPIRIGPFELAPIGLGCMNLSAGYGPADDTASAALLHQALDTGYQLLDTAAIYGGGHNETLIGNTLAGRREEFVLATKCGMTRDAEGLPRPSGRPERLREECEQSLRRLQTEVIDLYYLHRCDPAVPIEESVGTLGDLVREGKVQAIGLSEVCSETLRRADREYPVSAVQSEYSLWSRTPERAVLSTCRELGITFVAFSPLGRGFFAGSAKDVSELDASDLRQTIARPRFEPDAFAANSRLLVPYRVIAERVGCTPAQLALAWLRAKGERNVIPIPGTRDANHMAENFGAGRISLSSEIIAELDELLGDDKVEGSRYTEAMMQSIDSERD